MISKSNEFARRILNFPAIRPCDCVSFPSLLTSLISLGHNICDHKQNSLFTNKKNARTLIRLIENLVIFLEEIRNGNNKVETSMILSLSELHFIFQKVHFLLEDCSREDARLWMLVNAENVSSQFRMLTRAISVALEILPMQSVDVADEVKELVQLVKSQGWRANFDVEINDRMVSRKVFQILDQFEGGFVPESRDLRRVVEYLGISSWSECNREVKFLESEIAQDCSTTEKKEVKLLSSLMAFMIYCRCTLYVSLENPTIRQPDQTSGGEVTRFVNSDDLRCPITLEIMDDPVTISTGHTYDRASIQKWFRSGNHTCPKTGERLVRVDLVPNLALKGLIRQYCQENDIPVVESGGGLKRDKTRLTAAGVGSPPAEQAMMLLAHFLVCRLVSGSNEDQQKAAFEIRILTKTSIFNRSCLVEADAIPSLLSLLCSTNQVTQEHAIAALLNLSKYGKSKTLIVEYGGLDLVIRVLNEGLKTEARQHAAGALFYLASVEEYRKMIGKHPDAILALIELLRDGSERAKKNALVTIFGLIMHPENHWRVLTAGLVPLVANLLRSCQREDLITDCLAVLSSLAEKFDGTMAVISAGALPVIVEILGSVNSKAAKEYCVSLLLALCMNDGSDVVPVLVSNPSLMVSLYSLLTDGTSRASKKASSLIRILQLFNDKSGSGLIATAPPHEQFVHVW